MALCQEYQMYSTDGVCKIHLLQCGKFPCLPSAREKLSITLDDCLKSRVWGISHSYCQWLSKATYISFFLPIPPFFFKKIFHYILSSFILSIFNCKQFYLHDTWLRIYYKQVLSITFWSTPIIEYIPCA